MQKSAQKAKRACGSQGDLARLEKHACARAQRTRPTPPVRLVAKRTNREITTSVICDLHDISMGGRVDSNLPFCFCRWQFQIRPLVNGGPFCYLLLLPSKSRKRHMPGPTWTDRGDPEAEGNGRGGLAVELLPQRPQRRAHAACASLRRIVFSVFVQIVYLLRDDTLSIPGFS